MFPVQQEYRTSELSHKPGGHSVIIKYKGSKIPYIYNRVKSPHKFLKEAYEKNGGTIEWDKIVWSLTKKERMQSVEKTSNGKIIQELALNFINDRSEFNFKKLMDRLKPGLLLFVGRMIPDRDLKEEIVSKTFISIWEKIEQYNSQYNFSTWTYAIAKNEALGQLRISQRNISHEKLTENHSKILRLYSAPVYMDLECIGPSGEDLTQHLYDLTLKEIDLLEEPYKTVMYEREVNRKQLQLIAEDLEMNLNTVKTRLRKARRDIKDNLEKKYPELIEAYNEEE